MKSMRMAIVIVMISALFWPAAYAEQTEITFLSYFIAKDEALGRQIIADFERENPDIKVNLEVFKADYPHEQTILRIAAGNPPDVIDVHPSRLYEFISQGILADITEFAYRDADLADYFDPIIESVSLKGRIYALPQRISTYVLFYNKDLFDNAGLNYPSRNWFDKSWNWDTFYEAAKRLRRDTNGDGVYDVFGASFDRNIRGKIITFIFQSGNPIFDEDYTRFELFNESGLRALSFVQNGVLEGAFSSAGFANSTSAMHIDIPPSMLTFKESASFNFDVAALPQGPAGPATIIQPVPFGVVAASKKQEAAWRFLNYFTNRKSSELWSKAGVIVQPRKSVATILNNYPDLGLRDLSPFIGAMEVGRPMPINHINYTQITDMINNALRPVWKGEQDVRRALESIKGPVEELLKAR
ncbi:MAG TPA: sugar ABC transporter substrate-binding protein [Firmicutes bacterium]|nr:sugar ABC transporter substrate-binding protein [Bacillota bacterium]